MLAGPNRGSLATGRVRKVTTMTEQNEPEPSAAEPQLDGGARRGPPPVLSVALEPAGSVLETALRPAPGPIVVPEPIVLQPVTLPAPPPAPAKLASEEVIVQAPMSYTGSLKRLSRMTQPWPPALRIVSVVVMVAIAWYLITVWYILWGIFLVPWRLLRRHERNEKRRMLQHRETLEAMQKAQQRSP
jgi:hypothetical protein